MTFAVGGSGVTIRKQDDGREDCLEVDGDAFTCVIVRQSPPMELRKKSPLSKLEVAFPNSLLGTGGMTSMSLCLIDLLCFSLQSFCPSVIGLPRFWKVWQRIFQLGLGGIKSRFS